MYEMIDFDSVEMNMVIDSFFNKCKRDRIKHDEDCKDKTLAEQAEIHKALYKKQERYANDLFNELCV